MYYKVEKGTEIYNKLDKVWDKMIKYNNISLEFIKSIGFNKFGVSHKGVAGGVSCIESDYKPEGFKQVGKTHQNLFYPKQNNKELLKRIEELPIVSYSEYNDVIGFVPHSKNLKYFNSYGSEKIGNIYLITLSDDCEYQPKEDMVELKVSEYKEILKNK